jgi:hypothetical protein
MDMDKNRRETLIIGVVLAALAAGAVVWIIKLRGEHRTCEMCARAIPARTAFSAVVNGEKIWTCCPRCGLSSAGRGEVKDASATDFPTGRMVPADLCVFLEGSDLTPCCSPNTIVLGEKMVCEKCFDRCYPSLIAFADGQEALRFAREHGGRVLPFSSILEEGRKSP